MSTDHGSVARATGQVGSGQGAGGATGLRVEPLGYVAALDGLRALAVIAVLGYHGGVEWLAGGFLGVSMFFTLSGFLITSLLVREWAGSAAVDVRRFWSRRFRRLLPASWTTLALVLAMGAMGVWDTEQLRSLRADVPWSLAELVNWHFIAGGTSYAGGFSLPSPLQHFWSLAVEQQFYVVLPLLVVGLLRLGAARPPRARPGRRLALVAGVLAVLFVASAVANGVLAQSSVDRAYFGTDTRAAEMLLGALLALATTARLRFASARGRGSAVGVALVGAVALGWLVHVAAVEDTWLYPWGLLATATCTVVLILGAVQATPLATVLSVGPLVALGRISYGVYLIHWPVFLWLSPDRTGWDGGWLLAVRLAVTSVAAVVMYRWVEQPIRSGRRLGRSSMRFAMPLAVVALLLVDLVVTRDLPPPADFLQPRDVDDVRMREPEGTTSVVPTSVPPPAPPVVVDPVAPTTTVPAVRASRVLLVGDSVAASLEDALGDTLVAFDVGFATAASPGCGIITGFPTDEQGRVFEMTEPCNAGVPERQLRAVASAKPDLVVTLSSWEQTNREVDGVWYPFGTPEADVMMRRLLSEAVTRLSAGGAVVAFTLMPDIVDGRTEKVRPEEVSRNRHLNGLLREVAAQHPGKVTTLDLASVVCPGDPCPTVVDGLELRAEDGRHFEDSASARWVAQRWTEQILALDLANP